MATDVAIRKLNNLASFLKKQEHAVRFAVILNNHLVSLTPVDTGAARANWYITRDTEGRNFDKKKTKSSRETFTRVRSLGSFNTLYVNNNAPYIVRLNEGHSVQAPAGFIDRAVVDAVNRWEAHIRDGFKKLGNVRFD